MIRETFIAAVMFAQATPGGTSGSLPVSASVMATYMSSAGSDGKGTLELLVLWRGSPGWFKRGGDVAGGASGGGGSIDAVSRREVRSAWLSEGGLQLSVRFEPSSQKVWIADREIVLNGANVVLVDDVDATTGPRVSGTVTIDPSFQTRMNAPVPPHVFIRRSPVLIEYLRCDVALPDAQPYEKQIFDAWCAAVR
jgi:hypothetical protein